MLARAYTSRRPENDRRIEGKNAASADDYANKDSTTEAALFALPIAPALPPPLPVPFATASSSSSSSSSKPLVAPSAPTKEDDGSGSFAEMGSYSHSWRMAGRATRNDDVDADNDDPHDLYWRFVRPQEAMHFDAIREIRAGQKQSCWMWYVLPTPPHVMNGREVGSMTNRRYALRGDDAAASYLRFEARGINLRSNYVEVAREVSYQLRRGNTMLELFGPMDEPKAISSFRLFGRMARKMCDEELRCVCDDVLRLANVRPAAAAASVENEDEDENRFRAFSRLPRKVDRVQAFRCKQSRG